MAATCAPEAPPHANGRPVGLGVAEIRSAFSTCVANQRKWPQTNQPQPSPRYRRARPTQLEQPSSNKRKQAPARTTSRLSRTSRASAKRSTAQNSTSRSACSRWRSTTWPCRPARTATSRLVPTWPGKFRLSLESSIEINSFTLEPACAISSWLLTSIVVVVVRATPPPPPRSSMAVGGGGGEKQQLISIKVSCEPRANDLHDRPKSAGQNGSSVVCSAASQSQVSRPTRRRLMMAALLRKCLCNPVCSRARPSLRPRSPIELDPLIAAAAAAGQVGWHEKWSSLWRMHTH